MFDYRKLFDLTGKQALVVGAGSGIGEASALGLAAFGAHVVCADLNGEAAGKVAGEIKASRRPGRSASLRHARWRRVVKAIAALPDLDVLVVTPAINVRKPLLDMTEEEFDRVVSLNLKGTFRLITAAGRNMKKRGKGSIITLRASARSPSSRAKVFMLPPRQESCRCAAPSPLSWVPMECGSTRIGPGVVDTPLTVPIAANKDWYDAYAAKERFRKVGKASRDGRGGGISRLRCRLLCDRDAHHGRRRLDCNRRAFFSAALARRARIFHHHERGCPISGPILARCGN